MQPLRILKNDYHGIYRVFWATSIMFCQWKQITEISESIKQLF